MLNHVLLVLVSLPIVHSTVPLLRIIYGEPLSEDACLAKCLNPDFLSNLVFLGHADLPSFVSQLAQTCAIANDCIASCEGSNSTAVAELVRSVCVESLHSSVESLKKCFAEDGADVSSACEQVCGSLDLNNITIKENEDGDSLLQNAVHWGTACGTVKCKARCSVQLLTEACDPISNNTAGSVVQQMVELVYRSVTEVLVKENATDIVSETVPSECNYLYSPDVLFDLTKDELSNLVVKQTVIHAPMRNLHITQLHDTVQKIVGKAHNEVSGTLKYMQQKLQEKQLKVLSEEQQLLSKRGSKLTLEEAIFKYEQNHTGS